MKSVEMFNEVCEWLEPATLQLVTGQTSMTSKLKILATLMRLKLGLFQTDLAARFGISQGWMSKVLCQYVPFLARQLGQLIAWPSTTQGPTGGLYDYFPNAVAIIDCFELFIQRPKNLTTQKLTWSDYKHHQKVKYLIAVDPKTGCVIFISKGFSGCSSDRLVVEESGMVDCIRPGQRIMADRGFTIRDILA